MTVRSFALVPFLLALAAPAALGATPAPAAGAASPAPGPAAVAAPTPPSLLADFDWAVARVRDNYAGWPGKTEGARGAELQALTATLRARLAGGDEATLHEALRQWTGWFRDGHLFVDWQGPPPASSPAPAAPPAAPVPRETGPRFARLDARTVYLRLPSFGLDQAEAVRALVARHHETIVASERLVVDIRHNGGGGSSSYAPLLPYLHTRPFYVIDREYRASPDNRRLYRALVAQLEPVRPDIAGEVRAVADAMDAATTSFARPPGRGFRIVVPPAVLPRPARVALLIDGAASAAEELILEARQSRKVVLMGQAPSAGVVDFSEVMRLPAPSGRFELAFATTRTLRLPEDPVDARGGIEPDLRIPAHVRDPVAWAARALR